MRITAAVAEQFPLRVAHSQSKVKALNELAGYIGRVAGAESREEGGVGELELGGEMLPRGRRTITGTQLVI